MLRLILLRHGQTIGQKGCYYGWSDIELSALGEKQSEQVVDAVGSAAIDAVFSSDLSRAKYLGNLLACKRGLPLLVDERLREVNFGAWEEQPSSELFKNERFQKWLTNVADEPIPDGESMSLLMKRSTEFLNHLSAEYQDKTVAVTAHYGSLKCLYLAAFGMILTDFWTFHIELASITILNYDMLNPRILLLNDLCHLGGLNAHFD